MGIEAREMQVPNDSIYGYGLDLSHYNEDPDWEELEVDFVIMKATEGTSYEDPTFKKRLAACRKAGIPAGAYHYYRGTASTENEFKNLYNTVGFTTDIIPAIDIEKKPDGMTKQEFQKKLRDFISLFYDTYGVFPIIYAHQAFFKEYISEVIEANWGEADFILWFGDKDNPYGWYEIGPSIHQTEIRNVKGIRGKVDFNELHRPLHHLFYRSPHN